MAAPTLGTVLRRLSLAVAAEALAGRPDRELVERLRQGPDEAAFRAVLGRHGPMVLQVCRRLLPAPADAEDAFQATFLVLARRGHAIRRQESLGCWLHGVARRTALKLRTQAARRRKREERVARRPDGSIPDVTPWGEVRAVLDEELGRLPEGCRAALVLCYLEGRVQDEAAAHLGVSKSTLRRHLDRGRDLLARRLARRGVTLGTALAARLVSACAHGAGASPALLERTAAAAAHALAGRAAPAGVVPAHVAALSDGVTRAMTFAKYKTAVAVLACGLALGMGAHRFGPRPAAAQDKAAPAEKQPTAAPAAPDIEPIDPHLVFDPEVQKQLRLSPNQVRQLEEAREKGATATADKGKRVGEIDRRVKELEAEIARLQAERAGAEQSVRKAQGEQVKAALPAVLSRDAVGQLRQLTLQRMRLSDVLLDPKVRARLDLNDEQVKKIQELAEKGDDSVWLLRESKVQTYLYSFLPLKETHAGSGYLVVGGGEAARADLLKVLTPKQREGLERLSGMALEPKK